MTVVLGEMYVARVNPYRLDQVASSAPSLACISSAGGDHPVLGFDMKSATYPVDDVHQARMTKGFWGGGQSLETAERGIGCYKSQVSSQLFCLVISDL